MTGERPQGKTNLMTACEQGRTLEAKIILQKKPQSISTRDKYGKTALHYCAESGALACAQLLVSGADRTLLDAPDSEGFTPLHLAVISGHRAIERLLLRAGADPDCVDKERHSAVHWAAVCGDIESLDLLLSQGANPSTPDILGAYPIHYAAQMCGTNNLNGKDPETGLNTLRKLVQRGASIQCRDRDGREPLLWAASAGSSEAVLILFTAGANIAASDKDGLTALHCAASRGHTACVETLIALCGARVDTGDHIGCSPLFYAAAQGQADCAQVLLKHCADPNRQDDKGRTPAHCAAVKGRLEILRILDSNGADLWIRNSRGNLPLHEAVISGRKDLVQWLFQQGPRAVNATNISGRTPLHIAAQRNNVEMCEVLIDYGAFINPLMVNAKGFLMTPLDASVYQGNQRCAKYLQLHGAVPATKVLENNEINRNLLFSLGNYAYHQKDRSDEEPTSAAMFEHARDLLQPPNGRDAQTRTIRGGQQPPLPQSDVPPESELTNVMSEEATDASVHIHLTRDDLWSLWESLMQELTSEMSGSEISQGSEMKQRTNRRSSDVKQIKPILTNVYLRRESSRSQVIAGESILDRNAQEDEVVTRSVSEDTKLRYPRRVADDFKISLPKVSEAERVKPTDDGRRTSSSKISGMDVEMKKHHVKKSEPADQNPFSDSVGSDTEDKSAMNGLKLTRLRKRRSDSKSWGKEPEESETSSGHRQEQKEANPYLKRYFQKQARAAEMRKYLESQHLLNKDDVSHEDYHDSMKKDEMVEKSRVANDNLERTDHHREDTRRLLSEYKDDGKNLSKSREHLPVDASNVSSRSHRRHSKTTTVILDKKDSHRKHRRHSKEHKYRTCDCMKIENENNENLDKENWHSETCRLKRRHGMESPGRSSRKKHGTSLTHDLNRKSSKHFLELPSQQSAAASDERSDDKRYEEKLKLQHRHYHHHHHHHHLPFEKEITVEQKNHRLERNHKHRRYFHRRKSRSRDASYDMDDPTERKNFSDGEYQEVKGDIYSGNDIRRSKSEMSDLPWYISREVLTQSPVPEVAEKDDSDEHLKLVDEKVGESYSNNISRQKHEETNQQSQPQTSEKMQDYSQTTDVSKEQDKSSSQQSYSKSKHKGKNNIANSKTNMLKEESSPESSERKSKTRDSKGSKKLKSEGEKLSSKLKGNIRKSSPRRESKIPGKPPLRAAQSFSESLSSKTKDIPLKQKSQSARIEKDLPEIRVFSVEGNKTDILVKGELSEVNEMSEFMSSLTDVDEPENSNLNEIKEEPTKPITKQKKESPKIDRSKAEKGNKANKSDYPKTNNDIDCAEIVQSLPSPKKPDSLHNEENMNKEENIRSKELINKTEFPESHLRTDDKVNMENDKEKDLESTERKNVTEISNGNDDIFSDQESDSGDDDEPDEILYRDESINFERQVAEIEINEFINPESNEFSENEQISSGSKDDILFEKDFTNSEEKDVEIENDEAILNDTNDDAPEKKQIPSANVADEIKSKNHSRISNLPDEKKSNEIPQNLEKTDDSKKKHLLKKKARDQDDKAENLEKHTTEISDSPNEEQNKLAPKQLDCEKALTINSDPKNQNNKNIHPEPETEKSRQTKIHHGDNKEKFNPQNNLSDNEVDNKIVSYDSEAQNKKHINFKDDKDISDEKHLQEAANIQESENVEAHNETMETNEMSLMEETARNHVKDILQRAESEIQKFTNDILKNSYVDAQQIKDLSSKSLESQTQNMDSSSKVEFKVTGNTPNDVGKQCGYPEDENVSDPESTSEAETKFNTDSEEIQPEPDLVDVQFFSEEAESRVLSNTSLDIRKPLELNPKDIPSVSALEDDKQAMHDLDSNVHLDEAVLDSIDDTTEKFEEIERTLNIQEERVKNFSDKLNVQEREQSEETLAKGEADHTNKLNISEESKQNSKLHPTMATDELDKNSSIVSTKANFPSAEVQTDFFGVVNFDQEAENLVGFNRSISVQTSDFGSSVAPLLEKIQRKEMKKSISGTQKTISSQTDSPGVGINTDDPNEIKQAIRMANYNDISGKTVALVPENIDTHPLKQEKGKSNIDMVKRSPERHNPSALFYTADPGVNKESPQKSSDNQNVSAMFYTTSSMKDRNDKSSKSSPNLNVATENKDFLKVKQLQNTRKAARLTVRDRSLESERAVAIANSAFHRLNSNGELTVFNSSLMTVPHNVTNESKPCQRHDYSNLEKPGFLWVHFGSGSSPISTLRRKPSLTSQKIRRETKIIHSSSTRISNTKGQPRRITNTSSTFLMNKRKEMGKETVESNSIIRSQKRVQRNIGKSSTKKSNVDSNDPALLVSSKLLNDKKFKKLNSNKNEDALKYDSPNKSKSKIPYRSVEFEVTKRDAIGGNITEQEEVKHISETKKHNSRKKANIPQIVETEHTPRRAIPRLCNENSFIKNSAKQEDSPSKPKNSKKYNEKFNKQYSEQKILDVDKSKDSITVDRKEPYEQVSSSKNKINEVRLETISKNDIDSFKLLGPDSSINKTTVSDYQSSKRSLRKNKKSISKQYDEDDLNETYTESSKENFKGSPVENFKGSPAENIKDRPIENKKNISRNNDNDYPRRNAKDNLKENYKDSPRNNDNNIPSNNDKIISKRNSKDSPEKCDKDSSRRKDNDNQSSRNNAKDSLRENYKDSPRNKDNDIPSNNGKTSPNGNSKDSPENYDKDSSGKRGNDNSGRKNKNSPRENEKRSTNKKEECSPHKTSEQYEDRYEQTGSRENESSNTNPNGDPNQSYPRLSETAKSSSLDEGDVRLVIERKDDPDFSIKIRMSDKHKKGEKHKEAYTTDFSSTQCDSEPSYLKDSGYISTSESVHKHKRSITIDLGNTTAKINAGMKNSTGSKHDAMEKIEDSEPSKTLFPEVNEIKSVSNIEIRNGNQNTQSNSQKVLPSKLPVLNANRRRSNSMIIMNYHRTPRKNSISSDLQNIETPRKDSAEKFDSKQKMYMGKGSIPRQVGHPTENNAGKLARNGSGIPIYRAQSDSNLQQVGQPSPRISAQSLSTPLITDMKTSCPTLSVLLNVTELNYLQGDSLHSVLDRKMDSIFEQTFSPTEIRQDDSKIYSRSPDNLKLPSILLSRPEDSDASERRPEIQHFPAISALSSKRNSPTSSGHFSPGYGSFKLPLLQQPVRCRCSIEPHQFWDGRRTKSAVDCVANLHFLSEKEMAQFDNRLLTINRRSSYSSGKERRRGTPLGYRALRTQTLKRLKSGRKSAESVTFHVDHDKERNSFKLPTDKLKRNKKLQVVFTIGKSKKDKKDATVKKKS